jgi:two-component sensor histidine kinase
MLAPQILRLGDQLLITIPLIVLEISIAFITILFTLNVYLTSIRSTQSELVSKNKQLTQKNIEITNQHEEKIVMLKEIHHRVKNNLQIINSLIRLQSHKYKDDKFQLLFDDIQNRIFAMSAVHERIYKSQDLSDINIYDYFDNLFKDLLNQYGADEKIAYTLNTEVEYVNAQHVIPVGLILNELISNSLKHGLKGEGNISFTYFLKADRAVFDYRDDGKGFNIDEISPNFGLELIELLVEQMDGEMKVTSSEDRGVRYVISLPNNID